MKLLIYCGADVNAIDNDQNTPLHYIGKFIIDLWVFILLLIFIYKYIHWIIWVCINFNNYILSPHIPHESDYLDTKKMVMELLNAGAHTDFVNKWGMCPHTGYLNSNNLVFYKLSIFHW